MRQMCLLGISVGLVSQLFASGVCAPPPSPRELKLAREPRLQDTARGIIAGRDIAALIDKAAEITGVSLTNDLTVGDQKLIFIGKQHRIGQVLDTVGSHFDLRWVRIPAPSGSPDRFRLEMTKQRRRLAADLRKAAEWQRTERLVQRLEKRLRYIDAGRDVLRQLGAKDPYFDSSPLNATQRARLQLVGSLSRVERRKAISGDAFVSDVLIKLPASVQSTAMLAGGVANGSVDLSKVRYTFRRESDDGADRLRIRLIGPNGRPVGRSGDLVPTDPPRREAGMPCIPYATNPLRKPQDPFFDRIGEVVDPKGQPISVRAGLSALLEGLARASGLDILSDYHVCQTIRFDPEPLGKRPLWQLINIVAEQYSLRWERRGSLLLFRHREWFEVEQEEIPERLLRAWHSDDKVPGRVKPGEFIEVIAALTPHQMHGLRYHFSGVMLTPPYAWEQWLATLDSKQRSQLIEGRPILMEKLARSSREQLLRTMKLPVTSNVTGAVVRMRVESDVIEVIATGGSSGQMRWRIPLKQPGPKPIQLTVTRSG